MVGEMYRNLFERGNNIWFLLGKISKTRIRDQKRLKIRNITSNFIVTTSRVPQGTVLWRLLFLPYINDISNPIKNGKLVSYANNIAAKKAEVKFNNINIKMT